MHLNTHLSVTLAMICKVTEYICTPGNREMVNQDWLNLTTQAYEEAKLNLILSRPSKVYGKQYPPASFPLPDWYPRKAIVLDHDAPTRDEAVFRTNKHTRETTFETSIANAQVSPANSCNNVDSSSFSTSHVDSPVNPSYDPDKNGHFTPSLHIKVHCYQLTQNTKAVGTMYKSNGKLEKLPLNPFPSLYKMLL